MKIICTAEEKEQLIITMSCGTQCPFAETKGHKCSGFANCMTCVENGIEWIIKVADNENAEMIITHKDGSTEYINDIDSIGLLGHKDYGITYYGEIVKH